LILPADKKLPGNFETLRRAVGELVENSKANRGYGYRLTLEERKTRGYGNQSVPTRISFDSETDFFKFIGKAGEAEKILSRAAEIREKIPGLAPWVEQNPQKIFNYLDVWDDLLKVLLYFRDNPGPGMYIRELPVNVHTKFIERHKPVLRELLEYIIPGQINRDGETFEERFTLKSAVPFVRFRRLDTAVDTGIFTLSDDIALPVDAFNRLTPQSQHVVIVENQMTFLTVPPLESSIAVYGGGFNVEILKGVGWLKSKTVIYWGDIDEFGFLILSSVRRHFPGTVSIMMDEETFFRFKEYSGRGVNTKEKDETELNLTPGELKLYRLVREGNHRLEQEHLPQDYIASRFDKLMKDIRRQLNPRSRISPEKFDADSG